MAGDLASLLLLAAGIRGAALLIRQYHGVPPPACPDKSTMARIRGWARRNVPEVASSPDKSWDIYWVVPGDAVCRLPADHEPSNFSRAFRRQPYNRSLRFVRVWDAESRKASALMLETWGLSDSVQPHRPGLLVAWRDEDPNAWLGHDRVILKAAAFVPGTADGQVNEDQAIIFARHPQKQ